MILAASQWAIWKHRCEVTMYEPHNNNTPTPNPSPKTTTKLQIGLILRATHSLSLYYKALTTPLSKLYNPTTARKYEEAILQLPNLFTISTRHTIETAIEPPKKKKQTNTRTTNLRTSGSTQCGTTRSWLGVEGDFNIRGCLAVVP